VVTETAVTRIISITMELMSTVGSANPGFLTNAPPVGSEE
jgi:hypothetical protein